MINVITSTFSRHDLLPFLAKSLLDSTVQPDMFWIVDHSYDERTVSAMAQSSGWPASKLRVLTFQDPGAAYAVNYCMRNIVGEKIFGGDDIFYEPEAIECLLKPEGEIIIPESNQNGFACFRLTDAGYAKIGEFDESISPQYLYFEDCDYAYRMKLLGVNFTVAKGAKVIHHDGGSQTYKKYTVAQMNGHHKRFAIAQENYVTKWGGMPYEEKFATPYGR